MINFYKNLNADFKGIIYICLASLFFSLMSASVKLCSINLNLIEIIFLRSFTGIFILIPCMCILKIRIKTNLYSKHLVRTLLGISAMFLNFYAISKLPLSNYSIVSFAKIFFIIPLAFLFLKEKLQAESFLYISLGFIGIVLILGYQDSQTSLLPYYICAILATFLIACTKIFLKSISKLEDNVKIQFYFSLNSTLVLLVPYFLTSSKLSLGDFSNVFLLSILGLLAQYFTIEGLKKSEAIKTMPFDFSRIIFSSIIGISFFNDKITGSMIFGALIIFFAGMKLIKKNPYN